MLLRKKISDPHPEQWRHLERVDDFREAGLLAKVSAKVLNDERKKKTAPDP